MGYKITVYTDHSPITEIFKGRNLSGRLARWYLTIQAYNPEIKFTRGATNLVADALSRNIYEGAVTDASPIPNFSLEYLSTSQKEHHMLKKVIYVLKSGDEIDLSGLPVPLSQLFVSGQSFM